VAWFVYSMETVQTILPQTFIVARVAVCVSTPFHCEFVSIGSTISGNPPPPDPTIPPKLRARYSQRLGLEGFLALFPIMAAAPCFVPMFMDFYLSATFLK